MTNVTGDCADWSLPLLAHLYLRVTVQCDDGQTLRVFHRVENLDFKDPCDGFSEVGLLNEPISNELSLSLTTDNPLMVSPNPSSERISINYLVSQNTDVDIAIYTLSGQKRKELLRTNRKKGTYLETVDITNLSPGQYLVTYRLGKSTYHAPFLSLNNKFMKHIIFFSIFCICLIFSCKEKESDCGFKGFSSAVVEGNDLGFNGYAVHLKARVSDTINGGWEFDEKIKRIHLTEISPSCYEQASIRILNVIPTKGDTIFLEALDPVYATGPPTAYYVSVDGDATKASFKLLSSDIFSSWFLVDSIEEDQRISGQFNLGFVVEEDYKEKVASFNLPETFRFTNGVFEAEFLPQ